MAGKRNHPLKVARLAGGTEWDREKVLAIILPRLEEGMLLADALRMGSDFGGLPPVPTVLGWEKDCPQLAELRVRARKSKAEELVSDAMDIVDAEPRTNSRGDIDSGSVRHQELRANKRLWLAERYDPDTYGTQTNVKVDHHHTIDIASVLQEARGRVVGAHSTAIDEPHAHTYTEGETESVENDADDCADLFE